MEESRQIIVLITITLLLGVSGIFIAPVFKGGGAPSDVSIDSYNVVIYANGTMREDFTYTFTSSNYHMIYRNFEAAISIVPTTQAYIQPLSISAPAGTTAYVKDQYGVVRILGGQSTPSIISAISQLAELNEVGSYNVGHITPGTYSISYLYNIYPPLETDGTVIHLNLMLASIHIPYKSVKITLVDAGYIQSIYVHPIDLTVTRSSNSIIISGSSGNNELLEVEFLMTPNLSQWHGVFTGITDVTGKTVSANNSYSMQFNISTWFGYVVEGLALLSPFILLGIWLRIGREEPTTVPTYITAVPNPQRKPWLVNFIFKHDSPEFDEDGFYSTLLDLHLKKKIKITLKKDGMIIQVIDSTSDDAYERRVIGWLNRAGVNGVLDTDRLKSIEDSIRSGGAGYQLVYDVKTELDGLTTTVDTRVKNDFAVEGRGRVLPIIIIGIVSLVIGGILTFIWPLMFTKLLTGLILSGVILLQGLIAISFPPYLFGNWRPGIYKENLEWDAFRNHLSDMAQLKKYGTEDLSMWGDWLVYGTSLGVGDNVEQAMKDLNIQAEIIRVYPMLPLYFQPLFIARPPAPRASSGFSGGGFGGRGGGFGGGRGFGGRGGGAR